MRVYFPARADDDHWLVKAVGREAADRLCAHYGQPTGCNLTIPLGPAARRADLHRRLHQMIREGRRSGEIVRALRISRNTLIRHRAQLGLSGDPRQMDLFEEEDA